MGGFIFGKWIGTFIVVLGLSFSPLVDVSIFELEIVIICISGSFISL